MSRFIPDERLHDMEMREAETNRKIRAATEKFLHEVTSTPSDVMDGLAPRPGIAKKARAQAAFTTMLKQIHELRRSVELAKPMQIVGSGDSHE